MPPKDKASNDSNASDGANTNNGSNSNLLRWRGGAGNGSHSPRRASEDLMCSEVAKEAALALGLLAIKVTRENDDNSIVLGRGSLLCPSFFLPFFFYHRHVINHVFS